MASSGTIKSWVLNTGTINGKSCAGAYYSFEWTSSKTSAGVTTVSWNLYGRGRTSSPTQLENEIYLDVVKNGATTRLYTLSDSNGSAQTSFKNYLRTSGSFTVNHDSSGAGSFTINMKVNIWSGSYHSTSESATLDTNKPNFTLTLNKGTGVATFTGAGSYTAGTAAATTCTSSTGYHLTKYAGTLYDGSGTTEWTAPSGLKSHNDSWTMSANRTITAYAALDTYTISYNANGGSNAPSSQTKTYGTALTLTSSKPKAPAATTSTGTITVSYNANGGSSTPSAGTGTYTNTTTKSFSKWNTAANGSGTNYSSGGSYTSNSAATLYAQWRSSTSRTSNPSIKTASAISRANGSDVTGYTVTFNSNGSSTTAPTAITSKRTPKYAFNKWNTNSGGTGTNYSAATSYTFSANCTLYATWTTSYTNKAITLPAAITRANGSNVTGYTVTFNSNGSTATAPSAITSTRTPKYAFAGWNTKTDGSGTNYSASASYTPSAAITLYAKWTTSYQNNAITLPSAITRSNSSVTGYKVTFNVPSTVTAPDPITSTKTRKYTFGGWNTNTSGTGTNYSAGGSYTPSAATTLYAKWTSSDTNNAITLPAAPTRSNTAATAYTVTLNANGGSCSTASLSAARTTSYTFNKWNTASDGSGSSYSAGGSYTPSAATTLYSTWNSSTSTAAVTLPTPTRSNYTFKGWSTSSTATSGTTGSYTPTGNVTLYATWIPQYIIQFNGNGNTGGTVPSAIKKDGTSTSIVMGDISSSYPTRTGYKFRGWSASSSYSTSRIACTSGEVYGGGPDYNGTSATVTASTWTYANYCSYTGGSTSSTTLTLYAQWEKIQYSVTYNANGGNTSSIPANQTKIYGTALPLSTVIPTKSDDNEQLNFRLNFNGASETSTPTISKTIRYTFTGWNTKDDGSGTNYAAGSSYNSNAAVTLYAQWSYSESVSPVTLPSPTRTGYTFNGWNGAEIDSAFIDRYTGTLRDVQIYWKSYIDDEGDWTYSDESIGSQGVPYLYWTDVHPQSGMYVPVIQLKTIDPESEYYHELDEGDCYYYYGKHVVDGATYDCWQKQEGEDSNVQLQGLTRVCIYTNVIVVDYTDKKGSFTCHNSIELTARWTANTYTIRYVSTYGSGSTASSSHTYNVSKALTTNGFSRTGYTFLGWSTSSTATTAIYTNGQSVKNLTATPNGTVTLYAVWQLSATWGVSVTDNNGNALQEPVAFGTPVKLNITCNPDNTFEWYEIQVRIDSDLVAEFDADSTESKSIVLANNWLEKCSTQTGSYIVEFDVWAHEFGGNVVGPKVKSISTSLTKDFAPDVSATTEIIDLTGICPGKELGRYTQLLITPTVACKYGSTIKNFLIKDPAGVVVVNSNNSSSYTTVSLDLGAFPGCYNESNPSLSWTITVTDTRDQTTTFTITQPVKHNIPSNVHAYVPYIWSGSAWVKYTPEIASSSTITSGDIYVPFIKD